MFEPINTLFTTPAMSAIFSAEAQVRAMLAFEAGLARAEARAGIVPQKVADSIVAHCNVELFDVAALYRETARAGTPVIPLVRELSAMVDEQARKFVHWGATSQDAIDSALMLQMRDGLTLLQDGLLAICRACATHAEQHRGTIMAGRTLLQQALPLTFGLKAARWLSLALRQVQALRVCREQMLAVQLGGAAGTLASLGDQGPRVVELLAEELGLPAPDLPWHTERDRIGGIAGALGVVAGAMAKIAGDIALLAQTEVSEVSEGTVPGKGGSSAMPQKHNPVDATSTLACARLAIGVVPVILSAMGQEHERAVGGWQAEWAAVPELFCFTAGSVDRIREAITGLEVHAERMAANLDLTGGLIMAESLATALASQTGRAEAYRIVQDVCTHAQQTSKDLRQVAPQDSQISSHLSQQAIDQALDPKRYLGSADIFIDRVLESYRQIALL